MHIEFNDDHGLKRWRGLYQRTSWLRSFNARRSIKCLCFIAAPALVASMVAAGIPVRYHPLDRNQYVAPWDRVSDLTLRDLIGRKDFVFLSTVSFLVSPTGSNQTLTSDPTWNNANNTIECIGGGGAGASLRQTTTPRSETGGAGGDYAKISNFSFTTPGTTTATYQIATGGAGASSIFPGANGGDTWFNSTAFPTTGSAVGARGGGGGQGSSASTGTGGTPAVNGTSFAPSGTINGGGRGGNISGNTSSSVATGGGGAGGLNAAGNQGVDTTTNAAQGSNGGQGDGTHGGSAGSGSSSGSGTAGGNGTEWDASHGSGGGGGGASATAAATSGGNGGNYGGGGGACIVNSSNSGNTATSGTGIQGLIVLTWTPVPSVTRNEDGTSSLVIARRFVVRGYNVR